MSDTLRERLEAASKRPREDNPSPLRDAIARHIYEASTEGRAARLAWESVPEPQKDRWYDHAYTIVDALLAESAEGERWQVCPLCHGDGWVDTKSESTSASREQCPVCHGMRILATPRRAPRDEGLREIRLAVEAIRELASHIHARTAGSLSEEDSEDIVSIADRVLRILPPALTSPAPEAPTALSLLTTLVERWDAGEYGPEYTAAYTAIEEARKLISPEKGDDDESSKL